MKSSAVNLCVKGCFAALGCIVTTPVSAQDSARLALGETVFVSSCKSCHETGKPQNDAPQLGDRAAWKERYGNGLGDLYKSAIVGYSGYFTMPPRGGNAALSDDEVKAAVEYMLQRAGVR
jgi:cytochrome c5